MDFRYFVSEVCVKSIQEVASSILVSSTTEITLVFPDSPSFPLPWASLDFGLRRNYPHS